MPREEHAPTVVRLTHREWDVLVLPFGEEDRTRMNTATHVIAVDMPNTQSANALEWYNHRRRGRHGTAPAPCGAAWMC